MKPSGLASSSLTVLKGGAKLTKSAQGGPHLDIKQDLISESDLMR